MTNQILLSIVLVTTSLSIQAQQVIFETSDKKSGTVWLPTYGISVGTSIEDKTTAIQGALPFLKAKADDYFIGFNVSGKSNNRLLQLNDGTNVNPSLDLGFTVGRIIQHELTSKDSANNRTESNTFGWLAFSSTYKYDEFDLYRPDTVRNAQLRKIKRGVPNFTLSWGGYRKFRDDTERAWLAGSSIEFGEKNNKEDLEEVTVTDLVGAVYAADSTEVRRGVIERKALRGDFESELGLRINSNIYVLFGGKEEESEACEKVDYDELKKQLDCAGALKKETKVVLGVGLYSNVGFFNGYNTYEMGGSLIIIESPEKMVNKKKPFGKAKFIAGIKIGFGGEIEEGTRFPNNELTWGLSSGIMF